MLAKGEDTSWITAAIYAVLFTDGGIALIVVGIPVAPIIKAFNGSPVSSARAIGDINAIGAHSNTRRRRLGA